MVQSDGLPHLYLAAWRLDARRGLAEVGEDVGNVFTDVRVRVVLAHLACDCDVPASLRWFDYTGRAWKKGCC